ncbi:MAG: hypothetical protein JW881_15185 [Spirochaetales bacterium]|nr:hypothetical protein [Spirochaetales bacterium]
MADRHSFAKFFKLPLDKIPFNPKQLDHPKEYLINIMKKSRQKTFRRYIVPEKDSRAIVGKSYNSPLFEFINTSREYRKAYTASDILRRFIHVMEDYCNKRLSNK